MDTATRPAHPPAAEANPADVAPKSKRRKEHLLSLAGVWRDIDADALIESVYRARRDAPVSQATRAD